MITVLPTHRIIWVTLPTNRGDHIEARLYYAPLLIYSRERRDTLGTGVALFNLGEAILHTAESDTVAEAGLSLLVAGEEILTRLAHRYAKQARIDVENWAERLGGVRANTGGCATS